METAAPMIRAEALEKRFDAAPDNVLNGLSFSLDPGETLSFIGPSGCGKTTLLYILAGLMQPSSGEVSIGSGPDGPTEISFILQDFGLFPWKTVAENVALGLKVRKVPRAEQRRITGNLLQEMGIPELEERYPVQLSGGQKQRVAIARALATRPDLLLMDEPFSSLDALTREHLQNTILQTWIRRRITYILVTHSVEEAVFLGHRILVLSDRPARIRAELVNEDFGAAELRMQGAFFEQVREVRRAMEG